jgi:hypothetical protein
VSVLFPVAHIATSPARGRRDPPDPQRCRRAEGHLLLSDEDGWRRNPLKGRLRFPTPPPPEGVSRAVRSCRSPPWALDGYGRLALGDTAFAAGCLSGTRSHELSTAPGTAETVPHRRPPPRRQHKRRHRPPPQSNDLLVSKIAAVSQECRMASSHYCGGSHAFVKALLAPLLRA